jgi:replicative DNA helicase
VNDEANPPADLGAERQLLGALLAAPQHVDDVTGIVQPEDFYRPGHEAIYRAILLLWSRNDPVDPKLVGDQLRISGDLPRVGGLPYLAEIVSHLLTAANATYYAEIIARCSAQRALVKAGQRITQLATAGDVEDVGEVQARARAELDAAITIRNRDRVEWAHDGIVELIDSLSEPPDVASTPWGDLDQFIGGAAPGRLYVIGARPAVGKTVMAVQWAAHHAERHRKAVLYFSLEMSRREIGARLLAHRAGVDYGSLVTHRINEAEWNRIAGVQGVLSELPLSIIDQSNLRIDDARRIIRGVSRERSLGLVVVDYLQLMTHQDPRLPRQQQVAEFSRSLKLLARELEVPVVACSQLNRASEHRKDRMPGLSDLRESGAVEQDADVVILLHRNVEEPAEAHDMRVGVAKNRYGPIAEIRMIFQGHYQQIGQTAWRNQDVLDTAPAHTVG